MVEKGRVRNIAGPDMPAQPPLLQTCFQSLPDLPATAGDARLALNFATGSHDVCNPQPQARYELWTSCNNVSRGTDQAVCTYGRGDLFLDSSATMIRGSVPCSTSLRGAAAQKRRPAVSAPW